MNVYENLNGRNKKIRYASVCKRNDFAFFCYFYNYRKPETDTTESRITLYNKLKMSLPICFVLYVTCKYTEKLVAYYWQVLTRDLLENKSNLLQQAMIYSYFLPM